MSITLGQFRKLTQNLPDDTPLVRSEHDNCEVHDVRVLPYNYGMSGIYAVAGAG